jgi:hypothetical protein
LRECFLSVAGALIAVGMRKTDAFAMPMAFTEARHSNGSVHSYSLPLADGAQIDKTNGVILVRWQGTLYASIRVDLDKLYREDNDSEQWNAALVKV